MLVAFEGIDGCGKCTQAKKLTKRAEKAIYEENSQHRAPRIYRGAKLVSFPTYTSTHAGSKIQAYLRGEFGDLNRNHPYLVALMYALDRFENVEMLLNELLNQHTIVICDRYVPSNMAHQAAKAIKKPGWTDLINDIRQLEYETLGLPEPSMVIYLDITPEKSQERSKARGDGKDLHQDDKDYLAATHTVYHSLLGTERDWYEVECLTADGADKSVDELHEEIWEIFDGVRKDHERIIQGYGGGDG